MNTVLSPLTEIAIEGMEFYAHHGCFREETVIGTNFKVDLHLWCDTTLAQENDSLEGTINYALVYERVKKEMKKSSKLMEHVGARIIKAVKRDFPEVKKIKIKVTKINPPLGEKIAGVSVIINKDFED
ncbi:MAG: dihydroneopterin aldolase [Bacteroidales bacterium]